MRICVNWLDWRGISIKKHFYASFFFSSTTFMAPINIILNQYSWGNKRPTIQMEQCQGVLKIPWIILMFLWIPKIENTFGDNFFNLRKLCSLNTFYSLSTSNDKCSRCCSYHTFWRIWGKWGFDTKRMQGPLRFRWSCKVENGAFHLNKITHYEGTQMELRLQI